MSRKAHSVTKKKRVKKTLKHAKGAWGRRSKNIRRAKETVDRALAYAQRDRKTKKRDFRRLWITRINAGAKERGLKYNEFISLLKKNNIILSRDILARLAVEEPQAFDKLVETIKEK